MAQGSAEDEIVMAMHEIGRDCTLQVIEDILNGEDLGVPFKLERLNLLRARLIDLMERASGRCPEHEVRDQLNSGDEALTDLPDERTP